MKLNYCSKCSGKMKKVDKYVFECVLCKRKEHINPRPTNAVIIENKKGEILFAKRKENPKKGFWDLTGGFINPKETMEQSMIREFKEETGGVLTELKYFGSYPGNYFFQNENIYIIVACFIGKLKNKKLTANDDVEELFFVKKSDIKFDKIAFEPLKCFLKDYLKNKI
jgi:NAD+ diphosphatase